MSGLFGMLSATARALEAQRYGLDVTGQNIANVNTPGFARREISFVAVPPSDSRTAGGGVDVTAVRAARDRLLERRLLMERPAEQRQGAIAGALSVVEVAIGRPGESLDAELSAFFDRAGKLAAEPLSATTRQEFVSAGVRVSNAFREMAGRLITAQRDADANVRVGVEQVNSIVSTLAALNVDLSRVGSAEGGNVAIRERQKVLLNELSGLIDIDVLERPDGGVDVTTSTGVALVLAERAQRIDATPKPPNGLLDLTIDGQSIAADISGGTVGGYLQVRDALIPGYLDSLNALASQLVTEVNALHQAGFDASGNAGGAFFTLVPGVGAASSIAVDASVAADPRLVAAGSTAAPGDNGNARALAALRDARVLNGATLIEAWSQLVYRVGSDAQAARQEQSSRQDVVRQVEALNDAVSGVSLDEEAMMMMRFQRAYEANARFFRAIEDALDALMGMVRA